MLKNTMYAGSDFSANGIHSEAWGPPQFQEKRSRSEKAILGALGEFRDMLGAAHERFSFAPAFSESFFKSWGGPHAPVLMLP